ncbi:MAG TPA: PIN domain-containing protein [Terriglobia bacterium]|nr:PIN domain-containing protein [Terriglobia bacterium]
MILVDSSVWVAHFRKGSPALSELLDDGLALAHPFIVGELACGNLRNRSRILGDLEALPSATSATNGEVMRLIEARKLWGLGIGWIDGHLLASALLSACRLWTLDRRLLRAAATAGVELYRPR